MPVYKEIENEYKLFSKVFDDRLTLLKTLIATHNLDSKNHRLTEESEENVRLYFETFGTLEGLSEWVEAFRAP
jgi:hypothetical protein